MTDPIRIRCEGSGLPGGTTPFSPLVSCRMCGRQFPGDSVPVHFRDDILAMIDRGDFG